VNKELERMWKEAVVVKLNVFYPHFPKGLRNTAKSLGQDAQCLGRDSNRALPEDKA
jgi:hypothetical protein